MTATQGIKLDDETKERLKALGEARQRSPHWLMRQAIRDFLEREEKVEREKREDLERWQNYQLTGKAIDHDTAKTWLTALIEGKSTSIPK